MKAVRFFSLLFIFLSSTNLLAQPLTPEKFARKPKLIVLLVIDQFRSDFLTRLEDRFLPAGDLKNPGGFRFLMKKGAWFPYAEFEYLQNMTCPGHATIATGSFPVHFGFSTNDWFDQITKKPVYCAEDPTHGLSPVHLRSTTIGDEIRTLYPDSRAYSLALKDRSAIMLGGHRANLAFWFNKKSSQWTTSSYYNNGEIPSWLGKINQGLKGKKLSYHEPSLEASQRGMDLTLDAALALLKAEKLGKKASPDFLAISFSNHDILGHRWGPQAAVVEEFTLAEDRALARFFKAIAQQVGLQHVAIALTADHGAPSIPKKVATSLPSGQFDVLGATKKIHTALDQRFGKAGKKAWVVSVHSLHFYLNQELIKEKKLSREEVENVVREVLRGEPGVQAIFTHHDVLKGNLPNGFLGHQIRNSYVPRNNGDVVVVPRPFFTDKGGPGVSHMTGYSYDRTVPLILYGGVIKPGVYHGAKVTDLAPTLAFMARVLPPALNEGRVLKEIF